MTAVPSSSPSPAAVGTPRFDGRVAVITGASRGIGLAVAERIAAEGGRVCLTARKPEALIAAVDAINTTAGDRVAIAVPGKADDAEHQHDACAQARDAFGPITTFVNNTGINPTFGPLLDAPIDAARKTFDVNVLGMLGWVREAIACGLRDSGRGAVVNVASVAGLRPAPGITLYGASKAAVVSVTASLAVELAPAIRVNAVAPAVVKTKFATALFDGREDEVAQQYPMGRLGDPTDVAAAVAFLASDDAAWITGQTLVIDGGLLLRGGV